MSSTTYVSAFRPVGRHRRAEQQIFPESTRRRAGAVLALGKSAVGSSLQMARTGWHFLGRHREALAAGAGIASGLVGAYYAYRGFGSYNISGTIRQVAESFIGGAPETHPTGTKGSTELVRSALAGGTAGISVMAQLTFRASRHDAHAMPPVEGGLDAILTPTDEPPVSTPAVAHNGTRQTEHIYPYIEPVTLDEIRALHLPPATGQVYMSIVALAA